MRIEWIDNEDVVRQNDVPVPPELAARDVIVDYLAREFYCPIDFFDGTGPLIDIRSPIELAGSYLCRFEHVVQVNNGSAMAQTLSAEHPTNPQARHYLTLSEVLTMRDVLEQDVESFSRISRVGPGIDIEFVEGQQKLLMSDYEDLATIAYRHLTSADGTIMATARNEWEHELMSLTHEMLRENNLFDRCILARSTVTGEIGVVVHKEIEVSSAVADVLEILSEYEGLYPHTNLGHGDLAGNRLICFLPSARLTELGDIMAIMSAVSPAIELVD